MQNLTFPDGIPCFPAIVRPKYVSFAFTKHYIRIGWIYTENNSSWVFIEDSYFVAKPHPSISPVLRYIHSFEEKRWKSS